MDLEVPGFDEAPGDAKKSPENWLECAQEKFVRLVTLGQGLQWLVHDGTGEAARLPSVEGVVWDVGLGRPFRIAVFPQAGIADPMWANDLLQRSLWSKVTADPHPTGRPHPFGRPHPTGRPHGSIPPRGPAPPHGSAPPHASAAGRLLPARHPPSSS